MDKYLAENRIDMDALQLEDPRAIPPELTRELDACQDLFKNENYAVKLERHPHVARILIALRQHIAGLRIRAYHCTKEPVSGYFQARGLRLTDIDQHRRDFIDKFGDRFTEDELRYITARWDETGCQERGNRNRKIWACLSRSLVHDPGVGRFFRYFGGEAIYMNFDENSSAMMKLETIGRPVVVETTFLASEINNYCDLSRTVISEYHRRINPDAHHFEAEAFIERAIAPAEIIAVTPRDDFGN